MKLRNVCFLFILLFFFCASASFTGAQSKPNVSGSWKMNAAKSKFERGGPKNISIKFEQQEATLGETLMLSNERGDQTHNLNYTLDGKQSAQSLGGLEVKASAKWEGASLLIEFKNDEGFSFVRKFTLSADGKTMTMDVKQTSPNGTTTDIVILDKQ